MIVPRTLFLLSLLSLLSLPACGGMKSVPVESLAEVSTASVVHLAEIEQEVEASEHALAHIESRHDEISRNVQSTNTAVDSATSDLDRSKENRGVAVSEGDVETAKALGTDVDAAKSTVQRRSVRATEQSTLLELLDQGIEVRRADLDAKLARLEMARAQAAFDGGADVKLQKYERQSDKYDKRLDRETTELHDLEASHGTKLESFDAPQVMPAAPPPTTPEP